MAWELSAFTDEAGATCAEQVSAALANNLKFIDLRGIDGYNISQLPPAAARALKQQLDDAGLQVGMFGSPIGKIDLADDFAIDMGKLRHLGELAPLLGCDKVRIFSYFNAHNEPHQLWQSESLRRLASLRGEAEKLGLVLYHENEAGIFGCHARDVATIANEVRDAEGAFRMIFDFDNYNHADESAWDNWLLLADSTDAFHLKDSLARQHVPVGEGEGSVERILRDARARGWNGFLSLEPHLSHSAAVAATGPSGQANAKYGEMPLPESFAVACRAAWAMLERVERN